LKISNYFIVVWLFVPLIAFAQRVSYNDAIQYLALRIESQLNQNDTVAVVDFNAATERFSERVISDLLNKLRKDGVEMLERKDIEYILNEQNFHASGLVEDDPRFFSIGHLLGATNVLSGKAENMGDHYRLSFKLLHVSSSKSFPEHIDVTWDEQMRRLWALNYDPSVIGSTRFSIGARLGAGFEMNTADEDMVGSGYSPKEKSNIAFNATLYAGFRLSDQWFLQPELNVMFNNGMEITGQGYTVTIEYTTLDIPLLVRWDFIQTPVRVGIIVGPYVSLPIGKLNLSQGDSGSALDTTGIALGATAGFTLGYKIGPGYLTGDIRFLHDFASLMVREDFGNGLQDAKIGIRRSLNLTIGYEFSL
jgi:TolB-like protein